MENTPKFSNEIAESSENTAKSKLKEGRKFRNKQKRTLKKLEKRIEREQKQLLLKLQPCSNNITLITQDFADKFVESAVITDKQGSFNDADFPALSSSSFGGKTKPKPQVTCVQEEYDENKSTKVKLFEFISNKNVVTRSVNNRSVAENYNGNPLDSDMPLRKRGKHKELPSSKRKSKLKRDILNEEYNSECDNSSCLLQETSLIDNVITSELNEVLKNFVSSIVILQNKLYSRDPIKGVSRRRYVVGLHEVRKYLRINKVKLAIIAPNIKFGKDEGTLYLRIQEIVNLLKVKNIPYLFALKRKCLGILTLKYIPVSCMAILNYDGLEDQFRNILNLMTTVKNNDNCSEKETAEDEVNLKVLNTLMEGLKSN